MNGSFINNQTNEGQVKQNKQDIIDILDGTKTAKKAEQDNLGRVINTTYLANEDIKIELSYNAENGNIIVYLKTKDGTVLSSSMVDLPLEQIITSGVYNQATKNIELTLATGQVIEIYVGDLIDTYTADEITINLVNGQFSLSNTYKLKIDNNTQGITDINNLIGTEALETTAKTITAAINEVKNNSQGRSIIVNNVSLAPDQFVSDSSIDEMNYKADIEIPGVTANDYADVVFNEVDAKSTMYSRVCTTGTDKVTIYSMVNKAITIPTIIVTKGV